jgi:hypothetical protein
MAGPYGIVPTGFSTKPLSQIVADMQALQTSGISAALNLQPPDPIAVQTGINAQALYELWLLAAALYAGMNPDVATADQLAGLALLTGTKRLAATQAQVVATVNVNNGFSQAPGTMFATIVGFPSVLFTNLTTVANSSGGAANVVVTFVSVNTGQQGITTIAPATLTIIQTPIGGWNTITNVSAGIPGADLQLDPGLRISRDAELTASGSGSGAALRGQILKRIQPGSITILNVAGNPYTVLVQTLACSVLWNDSEITDSNGLPPHSLEVIAYAPGFTAPDDKALCALILSQKAAGITTYSGGGTLVSQSITDSEGTVETILATRPSTQTITIAITVKCSNPSLVTAQMVKDAITLYVAGPSGSPQLGAWQPGVTAYLIHTEAAAFNTGGAGSGLVIDITLFTMNGGTANIAASARQVNVVAFGAVTIT